MSSQTLYRLAGAAAIAAGLARIAAAWGPGHLTPIPLEALYDAIDALFLLGLFGLYAGRAQRLGMAGLVFFVMAAAALSFIGGPDADPFGFSTYGLGATGLGLSMTGFGIVALTRRAYSICPPIAWMIAALLGALGRYAPHMDWAYAASGVAFALGFVLAGWELWRKPTLG